MIYLVPTKKGLGVELWGTFVNLTTFYEIVGKFCYDDYKIDKEGFKNREFLISSFSYEIRKAKEGTRFKRKSSHFSPYDEGYFGTKFTWAHFLFSLRALKYNMGFYETNKLDIATIFNVEYWLEKSMFAYDEKGAKNLVSFIEDGLHGANPFLYHYMRSINLDFLSLGGGKKSFRELPRLLKRGVFYTDEYNEYLNFLENEAKRLNCEINDMEINDDHIDYENLKW